MPRQKKQHLKRRKDGRYCAVYHGIQFMGNTEDEALQARENYKQAEKSVSSGQEIPFFSDYAMKWLSSYKAHLTTGPYNQHVRNLNKWIEHIGNKPITNYTPSDVSKYYQLFAGMSAATIHSARDTIKGVFKAAFADDIIEKDPSANITPPKGTKGTHRAILPEERMLIHETEHRLRPAVMAMLYAGLRRGEVMALDVDRDVNFQKKTLTVREAVRFARNGRPIICRPKTEAGIRTVPLMDILARELKDKHGLLCPSSTGELMTVSAWKRAWDSYIYALGEQYNGCQRRWSKAAWIPVNIRSHDLRHSYCTMLFELGIDLKTAMLWMGHADQSMTMQIYTHLTEQRRKEAENTLRNAETTFLNMQNDMQKLTSPSDALT